MDPLFHAGAYYVQEASSMFLEQAIRQTTDLSRPLRVLDLCAAPGGKSTLIQSLISADSLLVSNEVIKTRVGILQENLVKWGAANTIVTQNDPRDFGRLNGYFDMIVADAPCSGSGLFRREPEAIREWSPANVQLCCERQRRILSDCWPSLKEGGLLIYSTCSYSREEDEEIMDWMAEEWGAGSCPLELDDDWHIVETRGKQGGYGYRFFPDRLDGEGFFITCIRKGGNSAGASVPGRRQAKGRNPSNGRDQFPDRLSRTEEALVKEWIHSPGDRPLHFFRYEEIIHALPMELAADLQLIRSGLYIKKAGLALGQAAAREFIPEHELAMSPLISPAIPFAALSEQEAVTYLRKEEIRPAGSHRGWTLVQFEGLNLGWIKSLPNRANNYYPKAWRILKR